MVWPAYGDWIIDAQELSTQFLGKAKLQEALDAAGIINFRPHSALSGAMSIVKLLRWLAQQDSDITLNTGQLFIYPSGLPNPLASLSRSSGIDADEQRWLLRLVKTLPRFNNPPLQNYRDILCEVIADCEIDDAEFACLQAAARDEEIQDADISSLHREVVAESGASLKHISSIFAAEGVLTASDIDAIDKELARKEEQLRAQRRALKALKDSHLADSRLSKTAQFDADVGLMIAGTNELPDQTKQEINAVLNNPAIQQHSADLMRSFESLEHQETISNDAADAIAQKAADFYSLLVGQVHEVSPVADNALLDLVEELRQQQLSPAQSTVWEKFLKLVEG